MIMAEYDFLFVIHSVGDGSIKGGSHVPVLVGEISHKSVKN